MTPSTKSAEPISSRIVTTAVLVAAVVAAGGYLCLRVTTTLRGAYLPFAVVLIAAETALILRAIAPMVPIVRSRRGGQAATPTLVPQVDVVVVVREERLVDLRVALRACRELRGSSGLIVVGGVGRRGVASVCRSFGVPWIGSHQLEGLGIEPTRSAGHVLVVPASAWVSPDIAVVLAPAFDSADVGAVAGTTVVHGVVDLLGSEGYQLDIDHDERLAAHLDTSGAAPPGDGPLLVSKVAARSVGGFDWTAPRPDLEMHARLQRFGLATRRVNEPVAYRMAPTDEGRALTARAHRLAAWHECWSLGSDVSLTPIAELGAEAATRRPGRKNASARFARMEARSVFPRLVLLFMPAIVAVTGRSPISVDRPIPVAIALGTWLILAAAAQYRISGSRTFFGRTRAAARTLGVDLAVVIGGGDPVRRGQFMQFGVLGAALASVMVATLSLTAQSGDLVRGERIGIGVVLVAIAALVRDASTAYRQQRQLPRVVYVNSHPGAVTDLSPIGFSVADRLEVGAVRIIDIDLPYPDGRVHTVTVEAMVQAVRVRRGLASSYLSIETDRETFEALIYFCAVTAPTISWLGGTPQVIQRARGHSEGSFALLG